MAKVIVISDVHLHRWNYGSTTTPEGYNSRLVSQFGYLNSLVALAKEEEIKHIICLGDLFHTNQTVHAEVLQLASNFVMHCSSNGIAFHCLVGNHDMASKNGKIHSLEWLRPYGVLVDKPGLINIDGFKIPAMPYTESKEQLAEFLKFRAEPIVLLHQGINLNDGNQGSAWTLNEIFTPDMVTEQVKLVLTGHYHKPAQDGKIVIVGSTMQHTWSDADNARRGCIILDLDTCEIKRVPNRYSPKFVEKSIEQINNSWANNNFLKVHNVTKDIMEEARQYFMKEGARSVEFEVPKTEKLEEEGVKPAFITMDSAITEIEAQIDDERRTLGRQLRDRTYEAPEI